MSGPNFEMEIKSVCANYYLLNKRDCTPYCNAKCIILYEFNVITMKVYRFSFVCPQNQTFMPQLRLSHFEKFILINEVHTCNISLCNK